MRFVVIADEVFDVGRDKWSDIGDALQRAGLERAPVMETEARNKTELERYFGVTSGWTTGLEFVRVGDVVRVPSVKALIPTGSCDWCGLSPCTCQTGPCEVCARTPCVCNQSAGA